MAILDRPLFQRRPTKDELRRYGLPAFANGGIVGMGPGQSLAMIGDTRYAGVPRVKTAEELLREDYGSLGKFVAGEKAMAAREKEARQQEQLLIEQAKFDKERAEKEKADREAMALLREQEKKKEDDKKKDTKKTEEEVIDKTTPKIGEEEEKISDLDALKKKYLEKSELYKELLGNPEEMNRRQGFLQLAQFGLNLASAQGSNFLDKVAKSAQDPLNAFAELGRKAYEDERAVNLLALEATEQDIAAEREAELEKELQTLKNLSDSDLTSFQKDLATIKQEMPNLDELSQMKLAKGLKLPMDQQDRVDYYFEILSNSPIFQYDLSAAQIEANRLAGNEIENMNVNAPTEEQSENLITNPTEDQYNNLKSGEQYIYNGQVLTKQ